MLARAIGQDAIRQAPAALVPRSIDPPRSSVTTAQAQRTVAFGRHERQDCAGMRLVKAASG